MASKQTILVIALALAGCAGPAQRTRNSENDTFDEVNVRLNAWTPAADVRLNADGQPSNVTGSSGKLDTSIGDAFDLGEMAFNGSVEMWEGETAYIIRGQYIDMSDRSGSGATSSSTHLRDDTIDLLVSQRFDLEENPDELPSMTAELMGGARYRSANVKANVPTAPRGSQAHDWVEAVIGARFIKPATEDLEFELSGDMSGFNIGSGSKLTWNAFGGANWQFNPSNGLRLGWQVYDVDWGRGGGASETSINGQFSGPILGWQFNF